MSVREDIGYIDRAPIPDCCRHGFSEEGFVHDWLTHWDEATKDIALRLAEDGSSLWKRWVQAALTAEAES